MANIKLIKRRKKSAQNISQITRAMEMVAASKMKKAQETALNSKPYTDRITLAIKELASKINRNDFPLLNQGNPEGRKLIILISTNKGLCGGLNTNLFRYLLHSLSDEEKTEFISIGRKGEYFVIKSNKKLLADFSKDLPFTKSVPAVTKMFVEGFLNGTYKEVYLVYNNFVSALTQEPVRKKILPIEYLEETDNVAQTNFSEFLLEPSPIEVLNSLLPHYLENQLRTAIFEAEASEQSARMIAMKNATDAALDLIDDLTLQFNKARQEKITYELADIVTARMAVE